jgi:branched-chain amino acid transport system permease protein
VPFLAAVVLAGLAVVPIGIFLALRAANLSPLFLGFATLAFGAVMDEVVFNSKSFSGGLAGIVFHRPAWLTSPRSYYLFSLAVFAVVALLVQNLRRSKTGLALAAMRDSEVGLGSLGVDVARLKLTAFSISAVVAGMGGAMYSASDQLATPFSYFKLQSLLFLALAVIGGIGSWLGAFAGAVIFQLVPPFLHEPVVSGNAVTRFLFRDQLEDLLPVLFGVGAIGLARNPHGIVEQIRSLFVPDAKPQVQPATVEPVEAGGQLRTVTFPNATLFHRSDCVLTRGKEVLAATTEDQSTLRPCPVCEPAAV